MERMLLQNKTPACRRLSSPQALGAVIDNYSSLEGKLYEENLQGIVGWLE